MSAQRPSSFCNPSGDPSNSRFAPRLPARSRQAGVRSLLPAVHAGGGLLEAGSISGWSSAKHHHGALKRCHGWSGCHVPVCRTPNVLDISREAQAPTAPPIAILPCRWTCGSAAHGSMGGDGIRHSHALPTLRVATRGGPLLLLLLLMDLRLPCSCRSFSALLPPGSRLSHLLI